MHGFQNLCKSAGKSKDDHHHHNGEQLMSPSCGNESATNYPTVLNSNGTMGGGQSNKELSQPVNDAKLTTSPDQSKSWICDICTKSFTTKYFLKKHKRLHTGGNGNNSIIVHLFYINLNLINCPFDPPGEMPYACTICGKTFTFQQSYHKHLLYHSDEKPHICATCGRAFKELSTLHNHERIHSGEKPFKCETCGELMIMERVNNLQLIQMIIYLQARVSGNACRTSSTGGSTRDLCHTSAPPVRRVFATRSRRGRTNVRHNRQDKWSDSRESCCRSCC